MKIIKSKPFQDSAYNRCLTALKELDVVCLIAGTGTGKTVIAGMIAEALVPDYSQDIGTMACPAIFYVTKSPIVEDTQRNIEAYFDIPKGMIKFLTYSSLRSKEGEQWFERVCRQDLKESIDGEDEEKKRSWVFRWKNPIVTPRLVIFDESHCKNRAPSQQWELAIVMTDLAKECEIYKAIFPLKKPTKFLMMSATSFTKASHIEFEMRVLEKGLAKQEASPALWKKQGDKVIGAICGGLNPNEFNFTAMRRAMEYLESKGAVVKVPTITTKYKRFQTVKLIPFTYPWQKEQYTRVLEDYRRECEQLGRSVAGKKRIRLVEQMKMLMRAEEIRWPEITSKVDAGVKAGKQMLVACGYQQTIARTVVGLSKLGYKPEDISIIWGGNEMFSPWDYKYSPEERQDIFKRAMAGEDIDSSIIEDVCKQILQENRRFDDSDLEVMREFNLGPQSKEDRRLAIDNFQSGKSKVCLITYKAGSVGLNLNHSCEYFAIRGGEYLVENADSPEFTVIERKTGLNVDNLPRPRGMILTPTLNPVEFLQAFGRAHRINSLSHTTFEILFFKGTREEEAARILGPKIINLKQVTGSKEAWTHLATNSAFVGGVVGGSEETVTDVESNVDDVDDSSED